MDSFKIVVPAVALLLSAACGNVADADGDASRTTHSPEMPAYADSVSQPAIASTAIPPSAFVQCRSCHAVEPGENGIGPSLHGLFGEKAGSVEGFSYSVALRNSDITWDRATLDTWLKAPIKMVPGTRMVMGIRDDAKRKAVIDYLETLQ